MLEHFFITPLILEQLRSSGAGAYIDGFAGNLKVAAINSMVPPTLRKGHFHPPDRLIALLKGKS